MSERPCPKCNGVGVFIRVEEIVNGLRFPAIEEHCSFCNGRGVVGCNKFKMDQEFLIDNSPVK